MWNNTTTATDGITVQGGSVTNVDYGVWINNWDGYPTSGGSNAGRTLAKLDGMTITDADLAGVYLKDNPLNTSGSSANVYAKIQYSTISASGNGILIEGYDASADVINNFTTITGNQVGIRVKDGANLASVLNNTITNNTSAGILIESTAGTIGLINNNTISGNGYGFDGTHGRGLQNDLVTTVNAENNWWGDATGPYNVPYNTCGLANAVIGNVDFMPWLNSAGGSQVNLPIHNTTDGTYYCKIQDAIYAASPGDDIKIEVASHTEGPQIVVDRDITLYGLGKTLTTLYANGNTGSSGDARGWILVNTGIEFNMEDMTLDGTGYLIWQGIRHQGSGSFTDCVIKGIKYQESGPSYAGTGIAAFGGENIDVTGCDFSAIGRVGILYFGAGTTGTYSNNSYTGKGTGDWLDYGVEVGAGAVATITGSVISGNTGVASVDGSTSAGILTTTLYGAGTSANITGCELTGNSIGIGAGYGTADGSLVVANNNLIYNNTLYGIRNPSTVTVVDGLHNWWGDPSGPTYTGNPCGTGDDITDNVLYDCWKGDAPRTIDVCQLQAFTLSGTTSICIGGNATLTLSDSQLGTGFDYLYDLYANNVLVPSETKTGTGGALTWTVSPLSNTTYTVKARNSLYTCELPMTGSAKVVLGPVTTAPLNMLACPGSLISVPITVTGFDDVEAISLVLKYDPLVMTYAGFENTPGSPVQFSTPNVVDIASTGGLREIRIGRFIPATDLIDGTALLTLKFNYISGTTALAWYDPLDNDTECEYGYLNTEILPDPEIVPFCDDPADEYYIDGSVIQVLEPVISATVTGPDNSIPMISGGNYLMTICSGEEVTTSDATSTSDDPSLCGPLMAKMVYTTDISTLPPTQTFYAPVATVYPPTSITPENHDGIAKTITFVSTPFYDTDNSGTLTTGDYEGQPITFVLTVEPTPVVFGTVTGPDGSIAMSSGNAYAMTICSGEQVTTSDATSSSVDPSTCGALWVEVVYTTTISTLPPTETFNTPVAATLPPTSITPENHDGVAKTITFVSTPYYDVDVSMTLTPGDVLGLPITFVLTVEPTPIVSGTVTGPDLVPIPMTSGNSYAMTICSGELVTTSDATSTSTDPSSCGPLWVEVVYTTTISTLPPTQTFNTLVAPILPPTSITPENHDGVAKTITFVSTPYYDVDGSGTLTTGDVLGLPVTFVLTVEPTPIVSGTVTGPDLVPIPMTSGNSYAMTICSGELVTTSDATSTSTDPSSCGSLWVEVVYTTTISTLPPTETFNAPVAPILPSTSITPENHDGVAKTITFVSTPYYDVDGSMTLTPGDVLGLPVTFVLTVEPEPVITLNITAPVAAILDKTNPTYTQTVCNPSVLTATSSTSSPVNSTGDPLFAQVILSDPANLLGWGTGGTFEVPLSSVNFNNPLVNNTSSPVTVSAVLTPYFEKTPANTQGMNSDECQGVSISFSITVNPTLSAVALETNKVTCKGGADGEITVTPAGGSGSYEYSIDGGVTYQPGNVFPGLPAGPYTITVKDNIGCITTANVTITEPADALSASASETNKVTCKGGTDGEATITALGGWGTNTYSKNGVDYVASNVFGGFSAGNYTLYVKDAEGCVASATVTITEPTDALSASASETNKVTCKGGTDGEATITALGGWGSNTYSQNGVDYVASNVFGGFSAGNYTLYVKDAEGCVASATVTITEPTDALSASASETNKVTCKGGNDGEATITALGGWGSNTYSKNGVDYVASNVFGGLTAGNYTLFVKDAEGCVASATVTVTEPTDALSASASETNKVTCKGGNDGEATIVASGGWGSFTYSIDGINFTNATGVFTGLTAGNYTLYVKDAEGCVVSDVIAVTEPAIALSATAVQTTAVSCNGGNDGVATITPVGGWGSNTFSIDGTDYSNLTGIFTGLIAGDYTLYVKDAEGCIIFDDVTITEPPVLSATVSETDVTCNSSNDGTITVTNPLGGYGTYQVSIGLGWQPVVTTYTFTGLAPNSYTVSIRDAAYPACEIDLAIITITEPAAIPVSGTILYYTTSTTPIPVQNVSVSLKQGTSTIYGPFAVTGSYSFPNVCPGTYDIVMEKESPIGSINSTDAAQVNAWATAGSPKPSIEKVRFFAGDVAGDGYDPTNTLTPTDANYIQQYYVNGGNFDFDRPGWSFWKTNDFTNVDIGPYTGIIYPQITINTGDASVVQNFWGLANGDYNRSYTPGSKDFSTNLDLVYKENILMDAGMEFELPVRTTGAMVVGAVSMTLNFPEDLVEVTDVTMNNAGGQLMWAVNGNELRIGWITSNPISLAENADLVTLKLRTTSKFLVGQTIRLSMPADPLNELADASNDVIPGVILSVDVVESSTYGTPDNPDIENLTLVSHPNPFATYTTITYTLPSEGHVTLQLNDMLGRRVSMVVDEREPSGKYSVKLDALPLEPGVYTLVLRFESASGKYLKTLKLVRQQ
jgi:hypothetical protein